MYEKEENCIFRIAVAIGVMYLSSCGSQQSAETAKVQSQEARIISAALKIEPPINGLEVPLIKFIVDGSKGGEIVLVNKGVIKIPNDAFVNDGEQKVTGNVELQYRDYQ